MEQEKKKRPPGYDKPKHGYIRRTCILPKIPFNNMKELSGLKKMTITEALEEAIKDWVIKKTQRGWK